MYQVIHGPEKAINTGQLMFKLRKSTNKLKKKVYNMQLLKNQIKPLLQHTHVEKENMDKMYKMYITRDINNTK